MLFTIFELAGAFVGGGVLTAGSWKAYTATITSSAVKAEVTAAWTKAEAELTKIAPNLSVDATKAVAAVKAAVAKL